MEQPQARLYSWASGLIGVACLLLGLFHPSDARGPLDYVVIGLLLGTLFGQTTMAAAWTAFGPGHLLLRLPLAMLWVVVIIAAFAAGLAMHQDAEPAFIVGISISLFGQWFLVQIIFWLTIFAWGLRLRQLDDERQDIDPGERQFGIRELMIFTAIIGVTLGIGRIVVQSTAGIGVNGEFVIFLFLGVAAVFVTLPLVLAALLPRHALVACGGVLLLSGLVTVLEMPALELLPRRGGGPDFFHFLWINLFTIVWVLLVTAVVRANGYRLARKFAFTLTPPLEDGGAKRAG